MKDNRGKREPVSESSQSGTGEGHLSPFENPRESLGQLYVSLRSMGTADQAAAAFDFLKRAVSILDQSSPEYFEALCLNVRLSYRAGEFERAIKIAEGATGYIEHRKILVRAYPDQQITPEQYSQYIEAIWCSMECHRLLVNPAQMAQAAKRLGDASVEAVGVLWQRGGILSQEFERQCAKTLSFTHVAVDALIELAGESKDKDSALNEIVHSLCDSGLRLVELLTGVNVSAARIDHLTDGGVPRTILPLTIGLLVRNVSCEGTSIAAIRSLQKLEWDCFRGVLNELGAQEIGLAFRAFTNLICLYSPKEHRAILSDQVIDLIPYLPSFEDRQQVRFFKVVKELFHSLHVGDAQRILDALRDCGVSSQNKNEWCLTLLLVASKWTDHGKSAKAWKVCNEVQEVIRSAPREVSFQTRCYYHYERALALLKTLPPKDPVIFEKPRVRFHVNRAYNLAKRKGDTFDPLNMIYGTEDSRMIQAYMAFFRAEIAVADGSLEGKLKSLKAFRRQLINGGWGQPDYEFYVASQLIESMHLDYWELKTPTGREILKHVFLCSVEAFSPERIVAAGNDMQWAVLTSLSIAENGSDLADVFRAEELSTRGIFRVIAKFSEQMVAYFNAQPLTCRDQLAGAVDHLRFQMYAMKQLKSPPSSLTAATSLLRTAEQKLKDFDSSQPKREAP